MKNIILKLSNLKKLTKSIFMISLFSIFFLHGCISPRFMWEAGREKFINKNLEPELILERGSYGAQHGSYFFNAFADRKFDQIESEGKNTRYYITYGGTCQYSILLDENNIMLSWRYETKHRSRCTVH